MIRAHVALSNTHRRIVRPRDWSGNALLLNNDTSERRAQMLKRMVAESERIRVPYTPFCTGVGLSNICQECLCIQIPNKHSIQVSNENGTFAQRVGGAFFDWMGVGRVL